MNQSLGTSDFGWMARQRERSKGKSKSHDVLQEHSGATSAIGVLTGSVPVLIKSSHSALWLSNRHAFIALIYASMNCWATCQTPQCCLSRCYRAQELTTALLSYLFKASLGSPSKLSCPCLPTPPLGWLAFVLSASPSVLTLLSLVAGPRRPASLPPP